MSKTISLECKSCESDFLAITGTKEHKLQICYRCFLNGMAKTFLKYNPVEEKTEHMSFEKLDLIGTLKEVQTDCEICWNAIYNSDKDESSLIFWKKRYNRMVSVANALRILISFDDPKFSKPYSTRKFEI